MAIYNEAYKANAICQEYERVEKLTITQWAERPMYSGRKEQEEKDNELRAEIFRVMSAAIHLRDVALEDQGLRVDEHFDNHNDWVRDLVPLEKGALDT